MPSAPSTRSILCLCSGLLCVLLATGCSSFQHRWEAAGRFAPTGDALEGRWQGSWQSDRNGHTGHLRCLLAKRGDQAYAADFEARYWKVLVFHTEVMLHTLPATNQVRFRGESQLPAWAGGTYYYAGHSDGQDWFCTYSNRYDHGTFTLRRR